MMIKKPTLVIDEQRCRRNIQMMVEKAKINNCNLRPHFKTHQSHVVGSWFKDMGIDQATVSSVSMVQYFIEAGWKELTIAFPVNVLEIDDINGLAANVSLNLLVESIRVTEILARKIKHPIGLFIKIDVGYHRTGVDPDDISTIESILSIIKASNHLNFKGFLAHAGHSYSCKGKSEIEKVFQSSIQHLHKLKDHYINRYPDMIISYGDTPTASVVEDLSGIDELRPGNFVYYDLTQNQIGSCDINEIAVAVACPIVALHPERCEVILYGGGVHLSKDRLIHETYGTIYGIPVQDEGKGWSTPIEDGYLRSISQEHGILHLPAHLITNYQEGDVIKILPVHSCMAADLLKEDFVVV